MGHGLVTPALTKQRKEELEPRFSLEYIGRPCLKTGQGEKQEEEGRKRKRRKKP